MRLRKAACVDSFCEFMVTRMAKTKKQGGQKNLKGGPASSLRTSQLYYSTEKLVMTGLLYVVL